MSKTDPDMTWSDSDKKKALDIGWNLEPVMALRAHPGGGFEHVLRYALMWRCPERVGEDPQNPPNIVEYVSKRAALGVPIYEKAWRLYGALFLQGMLFEQNATITDTDPDL